MLGSALRFACTALLLIAAFVTFSANAQQFTPARDGLTVTSSGVTLEVTALRDDVLRVRMWRGDAVPEDASWAVLPSSRISRVGVVSEAHGFRTNKLRVSVDEQLRLTIADLKGNILQKDAAPAQWDGTRFTVSEQQTREDHFFGLGDKPGPLDRAGEAFTMWNTDAFGWQESTDPIYKSIPFFIRFTHGRALGVFLDNTLECPAISVRQNLKTVPSGS